MISSLLIANRGEIARRIIRTAKRLGLKTVAVYSDADAEAPFAREADVAVRIGPPPAAESYLSIERVIEAAMISGAEAVHPGYGFLSENADFAEACARAGLIFVGPSADAMRAMGRKDLAKALMAKSGVPVVPGYHGEDQSDRVLKKAAADVGYPVLVKAVAGGGGKGMRAVQSASDLADALAAARREGKAAFGDDRVLIEKLIASPRHIEVQLFGDTHGNVIHLYERDCSLQRRHQKVIEEAPVPGMTEEVRAALTSAAVAAAKAVGYVNAGTVEFIADGRGGLKPDGVWFLEMNTRLQVEHPVTEMVTGLDLVELQLRVASGERLPAQEEILCRGHAIEARLYAEDPANGFLPSIGPLAIFDVQERLCWAVGGDATRLDSGVEEGDAVRPYYDPMLAKAIAHAEKRRDAALALGDGLSFARIWPVRTNVGFLVRTLRHPDFLAAQVDTGFIDAHLEALTRGPSPEDWAMMGALAEAWIHDRSEAERSDSLTDPPIDPWAATDGWRLNAPARFSTAFEIAGERHDVTIVFDDSPSVSVDGEPPRDAAFDGMRTDGCGISVEMEGETWDFTWARTPDALVLFFEGDVVELRRPTVGAGAADAEAGDAILAPMPGRVLEVRAKAGDALEAGAVVLVLEAMKMEHALKSPRAGVLELVAVKAGDQVAHGVALATLKPLETGESG